jgi:4-hydroxy-4-methyl-2-oxoglutarate aldolase
MTPPPGAFRAYTPVVPPRICPPPDRVDPAALELLSHVPVADVSDAVGRLYTMDPGIRPLYEPIRRTIGVALTVKAVPGDNLAIHGALGMAQPQDVLVVDWLGYTEGCGSGALSLAGPAERGLVGIVIDGGWRDVPELAALGFPVFGRGSAAFSPAKSEPGEINVPVSCGGVVVEPGDVVVADSGGVAVIPRRHLDEVLDSLTGRQRGNAPPDPSRAYRRHAEAFDSRSGRRG